MITITVRMPITMMTVIIAPVIWLFVHWGRRAPWQP